MRWVRPTRLPIFVAWMVILGVVAWLGTHPQLLAPLASNLVTRHLLPGEGGTFRAHDFHIRPFEGIDLYGVSLTLPSTSRGMTLVSADTVTVDFSLGEILADVPRVRRVGISRPEIFSRAGAACRLPSDDDAVNEAPIPRLIIEHMDIDQGYFEYSASDGRLVERISHFTWNGGVNAEEKVRLFLLGCDVAWDTHESLLTGLRGEIVIDAEELSVPRVFGRLNGNTAEVSGRRAWDGALDIAVHGREISVAEVENLIDMSIGFAAAGDLDGIFRTYGDSLLYSGVFSGELEGYDIQELVGEAWILDDEVLLDNLKGTINGASFTGEGVFDVRNALSISFVLEGMVRDTDLARGLVPGETDLPRTDGRGHLRIEHTDNPVWTRVTGTLADGFIDLVPFDTCRVDVEAAGDSVIFNRIELEYGDLVALLTGVSDTTEVFRGDLDLRSDDLSTLPPQWELPALRGSLSAEGSLAGPLDRLGFAGVARARDFELESGSAGLLEAAVLVDDVLGSPQVATGIDGVDLVVGGVPFGGFTLWGSASESAARVDSFRSVLGDTSVSLGFRADFGDTIHRFSVDQFEVKLEGTRWAILQPVPLSVGDGYFSLPDLSLISDQGALSASGHYEREAMVGGSLELHNFDLGLLDPFVANEEPLSGHLTADVVIGGEPEAPLVTLTADLVDAPFSLAQIDSLHVAASFNRGAVEFEELDLRTNFGRVLGRGQVSHPGAGVQDFWPGAELDVQLDIPDGDWAFLDQFAIPALDRLAGTFNGELELSGHTDDPLIQGRVRSAPFHVHWLHLDRLEGEIWADRYQLVLGDLQGNKGALGLSGRIEVPLDMTLLSEPVTPPDGQFYMQLEIPEDSDLEPLWRATNAFVTSSGRGSASVVVAGPLDHPLYQGVVDIRDAGFVIRDLEEVYHDCSCRGVFSGDRLQIRDIDGQEGLRGRFTGDGSLTFRGLELETFDLRLDLDRFLVASVPDLRAIVSGTGARLTGVYVGPDSLLVPKFSGSLEVVRGRYTGDFAEKTGAADPRQATVAPDWLADLQLHADPRNVRILNREMELYLGGDLDLMRNENGLFLRGTLDVNAGRLIVFNNSFNVDRGRLDFSREVGFDPRIDLDASTKYRLRSQFSNNSIIENIGVHVGNTLAAPEISFSSDQGYSREAIQRMLLGLDPYPVAAGDDASRLRNTSITAGFNVLEREIARGQNILDTFEIEQIQRQRDTGETGLDALIGVGKYIGSDLYLKLAQGIKQEDRDILMEYQINRHLLLQSEMRRRLDENQGQPTYNLDLKYRFEY